MVHSCVVLGCKSEWYPGCGLSFHAFPTNIAKRNRWLSIVRPKTVFYKTAKICSLHFKNADYVSGCGKILKRGATPFFEESTTYECTKCWDAENMSPVKKPKSILLKILQGDSPRKVKQENLTTLEILEITCNSVLGEQNLPQIVKVEGIEPNIEPDKERLLQIVKVKENESVIYEENLLQKVKINQNERDIAEESLLQIVKVEENESDINEKSLLQKVNVDQNEPDLAGKSLLQIVKVEKNEPHIAAETLQQIVKVAENEPKLGEQILSETVKVEKREPDITEEKQLQFVNVEENYPLAITDGIVEPGVILPNYTRAANNASHCIFPECANNNLLKISESLRAAVLSKYKFYIPKMARICMKHLYKNNWKRLSKSIDNSNIFTVQDIEHVFSFVIGR